MSTRSTITVKMAGGTFRAIYCHWNGQLRFNGKMLLQHYNTQARAKEAVSLGDLSELAESMEWVDGHTAAHPIKGHSVAHRRDMGEVNRFAFDFPSYVAMDCDAEYNYLWDGAQWLYRVTRKETPWAPLTPEVVGLVPAAA